MGTTDSCGDSRLSALPMLPGRVRAGAAIITAGPLAGRPRCASAAGLSDRLVAGVDVDLEVFEPHSSLCGVGCGSGLFEPTPPVIGNGFGAALLMSQ